MPAVKKLILLCSLLAPATLQAGSSSSAHYNISAETIDAGGTRTSSAHYTIDGCTGGEGGISSAATPEETLKFGYIGQLYDVTALQLAAAPATVGEGQTRQLGGAQWLDDLTLIPLPADSISWSVQSGPLTGVSIAGVATGAAVYQETDAVVQGSHAGITGTLNLTVLDTIPDNFGLYAGDGIADAWQVQYFGPDNPLADPLLDPDGDGHTNRFEFVAGLIPTDLLSVFKLRIEEVPGQPAQKKLIFSPRLSDRSYTVKSSTTALPGSWTAITGAAVTDQGNERTVTDPNAAEPKKLYEVEIAKP